MDSKDLLAFVRNDCIRFVTTTRPDSPFATLNRRVVITDPPELVELANKGDVRVLDQLIELLTDADRAWAAMVLLAALTGKEGDTVNAFATSPEKWRDSVGKTAHDRWGEWLTKSRAKLAWDADNREFREGK
jgi:ubiquinone biosynthesis protein UbiJ